MTVPDGRGLTAEERKALEYMQRMQAVWKDDPNTFEESIKALSELAHEAPGMIQTMSKLEGPADAIVRIAEREDEICRVADHSEWLGNLAENQKSISRVAGMLGRFGKWFVGMAAFGAVLWAAIEFIVNKAAK